MKKELTKVIFRKFNNGIVKRATLEQRKQVTK